MSAIKYNRVDVDGFSVAYREAGPENGPALLLLHGFPTSSHMFRDLIPKQRRSPKLFDEAEPRRQ